MTLTGDPGWSVLMWHWDNNNASKILSKIDLTNKELLKQVGESTSLSASFMLSVYSQGLDQFVTVTGPDLF